MLALALWLGPAGAAAVPLGCGVVTETADWNKQDQHGDVSAFAGEICHAVASAAQVDADIRPFKTEPDAVAALQAGKVSLVVGVTPSITREAGGIRFGPAIFYDAQSIMVAPGTGIAALSDLAGHTVCSIDGTDSELLASAALAARHINAIEFPFQEEGEMESALLSHHCQAVAGTVTMLAHIRAAYPALAGAEILPGRLALVPLAVATIDAEVGRVAGWSVNILLEAEALGIRREGVARWNDTGDIEAERLMAMGAGGVARVSPGFHPGYGGVCGRCMIGAVGNYGEIYDRTIGGPLHLPRGMNALWTAGGVMVPVPVR